VRSRTLVKRTMTILWTYL